MPEGEQVPHLERPSQELWAGLSGTCSPEEVGFGMDPKTVQAALDAGIKTVDISGRGGTSFAYGENRRGGNRAYLDDWDNQLRSVSYSYRIRWIGLRSSQSGGIRHPLDMVRTLVLGARGVGLSRVFLEMVETKSIEE